MMSVRGSERPGLVRRRRMTSAGFTRQSRLSCAMSVLLVGVAACSAESDPPGTIESPQHPTASSTDAAPTSRVTAQVLGAGTYPSYTVEVPDGWSTSGGSFVIKSGAAVIGLSVWDVARVPTDPCLWKSSMTTPGPTVDDLAEALVAQLTRNATQPADVSVDGYSGVYLEWSVPDDMVVTGDADFAGCDTWPDNGHRDFVSWLSSTGNDRYEQVAGQVDRLWVLDVAGQRLVVDATFSPNATETDVRELMHAAESLRFEVTGR